MSRNNFLPHVALALILILVAAFAGQLRKWHWKRAVRIMPAANKCHHAINNAAIANNEPNEFRPAEVLVKFKPGVNAETIKRITLGLHDRVEDQIESVPGLEAIGDLDTAHAQPVAAAYRGFPEDVW